jgi:hypothetical protein
MMKPETRLLVKVPLRVMTASTCYALSLALAERKLHLKPDHEWLEVAVGVGLTLIPVALEAHAIEEEQKDTSAPPIAWETYEGAIWRCFLASGTPIILWQIGETIVRKWELMKYLDMNRNMESLSQTSNDLIDRFRHLTLTDRHASQRSERDADRPAGHGASQVNHVEQTGNNILHFPRHMPHRE